MWNRLCSDYNVFSNRETTEHLSFQHFYIKIYVNMTQTPDQWSKHKQTRILIKVLFFSGCILLSSSNIPHGFPCGRDWWSTLSVTKQPSSGNLIHTVCSLIVDYCDIRVICRKSMPASFLSYTVVINMYIMYWDWDIINMLYYFYDYF